MRRSSAFQTGVWTALGIVAWMFLQWQHTNVDGKSASLSSLLLDSVPVGRRLDTLPKPFARFKGPIKLVPSRPIAFRFFHLRAAPGEAVPVSITAYCLQGSTRTGSEARDGVVAADPRVFPLNSEIEIRVGDRVLGLFRVEDTGLDIKGRTLDVWLESCDDARDFGRKRGIATLSPEIRR